MLRKRKEILQTGKTYNRFVFTNLRHLLRCDGWGIWTRHSQNRLTRVCLESSYRLRFLAIIWVGIHASLGDPWQSHSTFLFKWGIDRCGSNDRSGWSTNTDWTCYERRGVGTGAIDWCLSNHLQYFHQTWRRGGNNGRNWRRGSSMSFTFTFSMTRRQGSGGPSVRCGRNILVSLSMWNSRCWRPNKSSAGKTIHIPADRVLLKRSG